MPSLPTLSGSDVIRGLERQGFEQVGQRGSHIKLRRAATTVIVPNHRELRKGTLAAILRQAGVGIEALMNGMAN
jgi:predicted RNA binding protein YcfA (HicA-like mRNA interferase family)